MSFKDDLAAAKTGQRKFKDVEVTLNGALYTLRFEQMAGDEWAAAIDQYPPRPGVAIDKFGFNLRETVKALAPRVGSVVIDGEPQKLQVDPVTDENRDDPERVDEWRDLLAALSGHFIQKIGDAFFDLNVWGPTMEVDAAKKKRLVSAIISGSQPVSE
jgi:hypothetical protein